MPVSRVERGWRSSFLSMLRLHISNVGQILCHPTTLLFIPHTTPLTATLYALSGRQMIPCNKYLLFICRVGSLGCHLGQWAGGSRDCLDELGLMVAARSYELACPGMDCPEAYHLRTHYPKSFYGLLRTLPPAGPKTSSAEKDELRMRGFLQYHYL